MERPTTAFYIHLVFLFGWSRLSQAFPESRLPSRAVPKKSARSPGHRTLNDVTPILLGQFLCPRSDCLFLRSLFFSLPPHNPFYVSTAELRCQFRLHVCLKNCVLLFPNKPFFLGRLKHVCKPGQTAPMRCLPRPGFKHQVLSEKLD